MKRCPGDDCQNTILDTQAMCAGCQQKDAALSLWAHQGLVALETYLGWWALFESRYGPN